MKSAIRPLAIIVISLFGFLLIITKYADRNKFELTGKEMYAKVLSTNYELDQTEIAKLGAVQYIDIRATETSDYSQQDSIVNIPLSGILDDNFQQLFASKTPKVILAHDPIKAHEAWMLLTQLGYQELYVLKPAVAKLASE